MKDLFHQQQERFEKRYSGSNIDLHYKGDLDNLKSFLSSCQQEWVESVGEKCEDKKLSLPERAPSIFSQTEDCMLAFQKKGYNSALSDVQDIIGYRGKK